jgi:hypothetical protein
MTPEEVRHSAEVVMMIYGSEAGTFAELTAAALISDGLQDVGRAWRRVADVIRRREEAL